MRNQPLDEIKGDETLPNHQTLPDTMTRRKGQRGLLLLVPHRRAHPLLGWMVILGIILPLRGFSTHLGGRRWGPALLLTRYNRLSHQCPLPTYIHLYKKVMRNIRKSRRVKQSVKVETSFDRRKRANVGLLSLVQGHHKMRGECQEWLSPSTSFAQKESPRHDEWKPYVHR